MGWIRAKFHAFCLSDFWSSIAFKLFTSMHFCMLNSAVIMPTTPNWLFYGNMSLFIFLASLWSQQASLWSQQESLWSQQASLWSQMMHTFDSTIHRMEHFQLENNLSFHIYCMYSKTLYGTKLYKGKNVRDYFLILFLHLLSKQFFL